MKKMWGLEVIKELYFHVLSIIKSPEESSQEAEREESAGRSELK